MPHTVTHSSQVSGTQLQLTFDQYQSVVAAAAVSGDAADDDEAKHSTRGYYMASQAQAVRCGRYVYVCMVAGCGFFASVCVCVRGVRVVVVFPYQKHTFGALKNRHPA
jgi:hypothetical protein